MDWLSSGRQLWSVAMTGFVPNWGGNLSILNAKDFGCVGDGITDDTSKMQAAFDAAFGSVASPHGISNPFINFALFIPPGNYRITAPLNIVNCAGGRVFGAGNGVSQFRFRPSGSGNSIGLDATSVAQTPCIMTDGIQFMCFEDFSIDGPSLTASQDQCGIFIYGSGTRGQTTQNYFKNLNLSSLGTGILAYGPAGCDNGIVIGCLFQNCYYNAIKILTANALNWQVYGGGASGCGAATTVNPGTSLGNFGAAYATVSGTFSCLVGTSVSNNSWDYINAGAGSMSIIGGSSESQTCSLLSSSPIHFSGYNFRNPVSLNCVVADCQFGGAVTFDACTFSPGGNTGVGIIAALGNNGIAVLDGSQFNNPGANQMIFTGALNAQVWSSGCQYQNSLANMFGSGFTGTVMKFEGLTNITVSSLPTAAAKWKGMRGSVTDANATTFLSTVAGSGSNVVPVFCDGAAWKIG